VDLGLTETGIKMFENSDWNGQRTAATGQGIVRMFAFRDEILRHEINNNNNNNNIYLLQFGCHPVAVVILHVNKT